MSRLLILCTACALLAGCYEPHPPDSQTEPSLKLQRHLGSDRLLLSGLSAYYRGEWHVAKRALQGYVDRNLDHPVRPEIVKRLAQIELAEKRSQQLEEITRVGYVQLSPTELAVEPEKYYGKKVVVSGYYMGSGLERFWVSSKFGKGGKIHVNGSDIAPDKAKDLLEALDGFHRVLIKGVFRRPKKRLRQGSPLSPFAVPKPFVSAEDIVDLGRSDPSF